MSSVACFYRVSRTDLAANVIDDVIDHAVDHGGTYRWSGHVMMALLDCLDELESGLGRDLGVTVVDESPLCSFFTHADLEVVEGLDIDEVAVSVAELDGDLGEELRDAAADSVDMLRSLIADLADPEVLVVAII